MAKAIDSAKYLLQLAASEEEPLFLTHLQLQKLLYYVQGWSLALRGEPLFLDRIEAWAHGPVVRDLYPKYSPYGFMPITSESITTDDVTDEMSSDIDLSEDEREIIRRVWDVYKEYSGSHLRTMTHQEAPWLDARAGLAPGDRCDREITREAMKAYFDKLATS